MYKIIELSNGYQVVYQDSLEKEVVYHSLDYNAATKWCDRLNKAYNRGAGRFY